MSTGEAPSVDEPVHAWPAGWYPDPDKEAPFRYWNGERWTDRRRDRRPVSGRVIAGWAAAAAAIVGSIGPWATIGIFKLNGLDNGRDGTLTLIAAVLAALAIAAYYAKPGVGSALVTSILGIGIAAVAIIDINDITSRSAELFGQTITADPGWGIILTLIAGGVLVIDGFMLMAARPKPTVLQAR